MCSLKTLTHPVVRDIAYRYFYPRFHDEKNSSFFRLPALGYCAGGRFLRQEQRNLKEKMKKTLTGGGRKLGVFGSRTLFDDRVRVELYGYLNEHPNVCAIVTSAEPAGVCEIAQRVAKDAVYLLEAHFLNPHRAKGAFEARSEKIIASADEFLLIHDGVSHGTANELEQVKQSGKPYKYIVLTPSQDCYSNEGFNIGDRLMNMSRRIDGAAAAAATGRELSVADI